MLDGAGDTNRNIQLGGDNLAGLADLPVVRRKPGIDGGAGGTNGSAQLVRQLLDDCKILLAAHAAHAGNNDAGSGQCRPGRFAQLRRNEFG